MLADVRPKANSQVTSISASAPTHHALGLQGVAATAIEKNKLRGFLSIGILHHFTIFEQRGAIYTTLHQILIRW